MRRRFQAAFGVPAKQPENKKNRGKRFAPSRGLHFTQP